MALTSFPGFSMLMVCLLSVLLFQSEGCARMLRKVKWSLGVKVWCRAFDEPDGRTMFNEDRGLRLCRSES